MVLVHAPVNTEGSLRVNDPPMDIDNLIKDYHDIKISVCQSCMDGCQTMLKKFRKCDDMDRCGLLRNYVIVPATKSSCSSLSESCNDNLEETLKKLYDAGAVSDDKLLVKEIDKKIQELTKLKHTLKGVAASSHIVPVRGSITGKIGNSPSSLSNTSSNGQAELEKEEATV